MSIITKQIIATLALGIAVTLSVALIFSFIG